MPSELDSFIFIIAGVLSSTVSNIATAPIERVKLLLQTQDVNPRVLSGEEPRYHGIIDCISRVASDQGISAFWRGTWAKTIGYFPVQFFHMAFNGYINAIAPTLGKDRNVVQLFKVTSRFLSGAGSAFALYPFSYASTRLATDVGKGQPQFKGLVDCLRQTFSVNGMEGIYNGVGVSIAGIVPYRGVYFGVFSALSVFNPFRKSENAPLAATSMYLCAQIASLAALYAAYPFDTIRTRLQMQSDTPKDKRPYDGIMDCYQKILKDEGVGGLFKGAGVSAFTTIGTSIAFVLSTSILAVPGER